ncbi:unnamed protein product [Adineta steineri]|uniref:Uncharacterized protein n=1 Tax=Adineta steineri TaxID=433720 RepID=A0A814NFP4_9BILA|nr:unnamed protein product [Adineta steineri]CAF1182471.1 unnamed protein product [Adineta steineri]
MVKSFILVVTTKIAGIIHLPHWDKLDSLFPPSGIVTDNASVGKASDSISLTVNQSPSLKRNVVPKLKMIDETCDDDSSLKNTSTTTTVTTGTTTTTISTTSTTSVTTSTSTSTTSSTSASTTSTTSITTTTTTVTTPIPPCSPVSVGNASTIFTATSISTSSYQCETFQWTSPTTGMVSLTFQFRHDPSTWYLDDVSIYHGAVQMLTNGGFESGTMSPWVRTTPNGACSGWPSQVSTTVHSVSPHTGTYYYIDGSYGCADQISQSFMATAGEIYIVSFWLQSGSSGSGVSVSVTL